MNQILMYLITFGAIVIGVFSIKGDNKMGFCGGRFSRMWKKPDEKVLKETVEGVKHVNEQRLLAEKENEARAIETTEGE